MADVGGFSELLPKMQRGVTDLDLADKLREVVKAVLQAQKPGSLTLQVTVKPNGESAVYLGVKIKSTEPVATEDTLFFIDLDGNLVRDTPRQERLPFGEERGE